VDSDTVQASDVLRDEHRLALDGYHIDVVPVETDVTLAKISLMSGQETFQLEVIKLDADCSTRDESILTAMIGFMNSGGNPRRLIELADVVGELPHIQLAGYKVLGAYGSVTWVSYCQHPDGRLFEVHHGIMSEEISAEQLDVLLDEGFDEGGIPSDANRQPDCCGAPLQLGSRAQDAE